MAEEEKMKMKKKRFGSKQSNGPQAGWASVCHDFRMRRMSII